MNENFEFIIFTNESQKNYDRIFNPENILEIFAFKEEEKIISYDFLEYNQDKELRKIKLFDHFLRNLFIDLKKFSQNKFETNFEDISFTRINLKI